VFRYLVPFFLVGLVLALILPEKRLTDGISEAPSAH